MFERQCQPGLPYGIAHGVELALDLYLPELPASHPKPVPAVVYIHGGGWVRGSSGSPTGVTFALEMAAEGFVVACINYRLAPAHPAPAAILDAKLAVRWLRDNAETYGVDPRRIIAMGNSAGGHLAAMLALTRPDDGFEGKGLTHVPSSVMAAVDICGITDVEELVEGAKATEWAAAWVPVSTPNRRELARNCSPIRYARAAAPPMLIIHGDADPYVPYSQSVRLEAALKEKGADAELETIPGAGHMLGISGPSAVQQAVRLARRKFLSRLGLL